MICLSLTGSTRDDWSRAITTNRVWIDLLELRVDMLKPAERGVDDLAAWWKEQYETHGLPAILTIRRSPDLGRWEGDEAQRLHLFTRLVNAIQPAYIDIELDRAGIADWDRLAGLVKSLGGMVIRSHHEGRHTPDGLPALMARLAGGEQEIPKLAVTPQSEVDTVRLVKSAREFGKLMRGRRGIWIGMGEFGLPTRVWPAKTDSMWTYASDPQAVAAAPGHIGPQELSEVFRAGGREFPERADGAGGAREASPAFAVIGSPILHSRSPRYHNGRFHAEGLNAVYLPIRMDSFDSFSAVTETYDLQGISVTVPHKENAYEFVRGSYADNVTTAASASGAANTLWRDQDGWHADNTDVAAFHDSLADAYQKDTNREMSTARVLVIGAGGAARAVLAALYGRVASVSIVNRSVSRALAVARSYGISESAVYSPEQLSSFDADRFDIVVQTTSVGMDHGVEGDPSEGYSFSGNELAYDVIYTPEETPFLRRAREAGCKAVNGADMFERQAVLQFEIFGRLISSSGSG